MKNINDMKMVDILFYITISLIILLVFLTIILLSTVNSVATTNRTLDINRYKTEYEDINKILDKTEEEFQNDSYYSGLKEMSRIIELDPKGREQIINHLKSIYISLLDEDMTAYHSQMNRLGGVDGFEN